MATYYVDLDISTVGIGTQNDPFGASILYTSAGDNMFLDDCTYLMKGSHTMSGDTPSNPTNSATLDWWNNGFSCGYIILCKRRLNI